SIPNPSPLNLTPLKVVSVNPHSSLITFHSSLFLWRPGSPEGGVEGSARGDAGPPAAAVEIAAGDRGFARAAEVGGQNIDPFDRGAPRVPVSGGERGAVGDGGPP